ncbi:MAG: hypothetical protein HC860_06400 [Alkalinema sp. RU_4_3]|nr:hypothetical protein [Alkalinema sp. RU_4_3]
MKNQNQWLFEAPYQALPNSSINSEFEVLPTFGIDSRSVIDPRIDVSAQRALMTMLNSNPIDRAIALRTVSSVKSGNVTGLYQQDQKVPALLARRMNTSWWLLLGNSNSDMFCEPATMSAPFTFVFRRNLNQQLLIQEIRLEFGKPVLTAAC